ncbi:MAG TPA: hypothetical protein ENG05_00990, partial [Acidilobales archaeon]|nr:hypothetical protein [Acidilobales archaeon]
MGRRFCVRCGTEERPGYPIIDGLCPKCFLRERSIVKLPSKIELTICPSCGSVQLGSRWIMIAGNMENILEYYLNKLLIKRENLYEGFSEVRIRVKELMNSKVKLAVEGWYGGNKIIQESLINVRIKRRLCPRCIKVKVGSYEALVQIRYVGGIDRSLNREIIKLIMSNEKIFKSLSDIEEVKEGLNLKFLDQSIAKYLANIIKKKYGAKIIQSWSDAGYVSGRKHSKLTIAVRLPVLKVGDVITISNEDLALVLDVKDNHVAVRFLRSGLVGKISYDELWSRGFNKLSPK